MKSNKINPLHLESMKLIILTFILTISNSALAVEDDAFFITLSKCARTEFDMSKASEFKILSAPEMSIVCSRESKIVCKIMEKTDKGSQLTSERKYEVYANLADIAEIRNTDDHNQSIIVNQKLKKAMYFSKEIKSLTIVTQTFCSGVYNDSKDIKKLINPTKSAPNQYKKPSIPLDPGMIGE